MIQITHIKPNIPVTWDKTPGFVPTLGWTGPKVLCGRPMRLTGHFRYTEGGEKQVECVGVLAGEQSRFWMYADELSMVH